MPISRVTSKATNNTAQLRVIKRQRLSDFYGSLRAERLFPGKDAVREEVGQELARRTKRSES